MAGAGLAERKRRAANAGAPGGGSDATRQPGAPTDRSRARPNLLRWPVLGHFLRWRWSRPVLQLVLFAMATVLVVHGLLGPTLAPKNLATLLTWVHYRGLLVLVLLFAGNLFCMGCPLLLARDLARRFRTPRLRFPRALRNKWLSIVLFVGVLFAYEAWDLWGDPTWTALLILAYFALAFIVDSLFRRAPFCKYLCPVGQFNFVGSTLSPLEVRAADLDTCATCETADCIRGRRDAEDRKKVLQRGCELNLYLPLKEGNLDCTFCLDCVHACPHDNVALTTRMPGDELALDEPRSGIGRLGERPDLAVLVMVFTFGALLNAFGMVSPVYAFQEWLATWLGTRNESVVLGVLFALGLVVEPAVLLLLTAWAALRLSKRDEPLLRHVARFAYGLAPLGFGIWAAHYCFHFLTGLWTFVPVAQSAAADLGLSLGEPQWGRGGWSANAVQPVELGLLLLGLAGSIAVTLQLAQRDFGTARARAATPWIALHVLLFSTAVWLLAQPMEMRGTFL